MGSSETVRRTRAGHDVAMGILIGSNQEVDLCQAPPLWNVVAECGDCSGSRLGKQKQRRVGGSPQVRGEGALWSWGGGPPRVGPAAFGGQRVQPRPGKSLEPDLGLEPLFLDVPEPVLPLFGLGREGGAAFDSRGSQHCKRGKV